MTRGSQQQREDWAGLMARAQDGDRAAYDRLLRELLPYLRALAWRHLRSDAAVDDAAQDILLTIHRVRHTYDPRRPFAPWVVTIARRRILDHLRKTMRRDSREQAFDGGEDEISETATATFSVDEANSLEASAGNDVLHRAIARLPAAQRQAIDLLKLKEMTLLEASEATGLSVSALKVSVHRATKALRRMMAREDGP